MSGKHTKRNLAIGILTALMLILAVLASVKIRSIKITGNSRYSDEQMVDMLFPEAKDRNAFYSYLMNLSHKKKAIPFVEAYELVYHSPVDVEVIVYEKAVTGYVQYMSSYLYFDREGIIVESTNQRIEGIPWVTGLEFGQVVLYQRLPVRDERVFKVILNLTQLLSKHEMEVDKILFRPDGDITLYLEGIEVELGDEEYIEGKVSRLNDMLPKLKGESGTLYLDTYDEVDSDKMFSFVPG